PGFKTSRCTISDFSMALRSSSGFSKSINLLSEFVSIFSGSLSMDSSATGSSETDSSTLSIISTHPLSTIAAIKTTKNLLIPLKTPLRKHFKIHQLKIKCNKLQLSEQETKDAGT